MKPARRSSILHAIAFPLAILLYWQALGWIAFGLLEPGISQSTGSPVDSRFVLSVGIVMTIATTILGSFLLYYRPSTSGSVWAQSFHPGWIGHKEMIALSADKLGK